MTTHKRGSPQGRPRCIFCDAEGVTGEHLWPHWMTKLLRKDGEKNFTPYVQIESFRNLDTGEVTTGKPRRGRTTGPARARKYRIACRTCNGGWMSVIEQRAKPILSALFHGSASELTTEDQAALSRWAVLKSIEGEQDDGALGVLQADKQEIFGGKPISVDRWAVWIAPHRGARSVVNFSHGADRVRDGGARDWCFHAGFFVGELFLCVRYRSDPGMPVLDIDNLLSACMLQIFPPLPSSQSLLFRQLQSDATTNALINSVNRRLDLFRWHDRRS